MVRLETLKGLLGLLLPDVRTHPNDQGVVIFDSGHGETYNGT
jgi:hypothetical protein